MRVVRTFFTLIDYAVPDPLDLKNLYGSWNWSFLTNRIRTFCFQFFNNSLGIGSRIAARYRRGGQVIDQRCTFCVRSGALVPMREDFSHIFMHCPYLEPVSSQIRTEYFPDSDDLDYKRKVFFTGLVSNVNADDAFLYSLSAILINYTIWQWKLKKIVPSVASVRLEVNELFFNIAFYNNRIRKMISDSNVPLCRRWREQRGGRG
jgi:hypothetical protein